MKTKNYIISLLLLLVFASFALQVQAEEINFPAGSLVIPMDSFYQSDDDGGILEAFGMVFYLLNHRTDGDPDITLYWMINQDKVDIGDSDVEIEVTAAGLTAYGADAVAKLYDHDNTSSDLTMNTGDSSLKVTYSGGPFIISADDAGKARAIIDLANWDAVDVHQIQVPFAAEVYQQLRGTPPRIALMNDSEATDSGNAEILEAYLRLAGICTDIYDVVTPCQIRDGKLTEGDGYDFLWAPHWEGYKKYGNDDDICSADTDSVTEVEEIVLKVQEFLLGGKALLAECASIEVFEHSENGRFLTDKGFGHNDGTNNSEDIIYNDVTVPNAQVGDFTYEPEGGHLHNWRPFETGDSYNLEDYGGLPDVSGGKSVYNDTVNRYVIDNTGWDYYVGGNAYGNTENGYVVYLGGHKYAKCDGAVGDLIIENNIHLMEFEFDQDLSKEIVTLEVNYTVGVTPHTTTISFDVSDPFTAISGDPLEIDISTGKRDKKKLKDITFTNLGTDDISVDSMKFTWTAGDKTPQYIKKGINLKLDKLILWNAATASGIELDHEDFIIDGIYVDTGAANCSNNDDCEWTNVAGVRYILNSLFNIKAHIISKEYVRAAPIIKFPWLYQGSFEYPNGRGHFRRLDVRTGATANDGGITYELDDAEWDTANGGIRSADDDGRYIYTTQPDNWSSKVTFSVGNVAALDTLLDITPGNGDNTAEEAVITRVRGKYWNPDHFNSDDGSYGAWVELTNRLGGIEHSAPVIVDIGRTTGRPEMAYVGDLHGMLHAIETSSGDEKWAYIPSAVLGKLQNDRNDDNAYHNFAAVDGSPTAVDVYYDPPNIGAPGDSDEYDKQWRTILSTPGGKGGQYVFTLDITDPTDDEDGWSVLWEYTGDTILSYTDGTNDNFFTVGATITVDGDETGDPAKATGVIESIEKNDSDGGDLVLKDITGIFDIGDVVADDPKTLTVSKVIEMGNASRVSIGKLQWPIKNEAGEITDYETKYVVFVSTGFSKISTSVGGINVFAIDLQTGERLWYFSESYIDSVNDIPGAITLYDVDGDKFADRLYVGDMNGRMWELDTLTGTNPHGTETVGGVEKQIPLWNAGVGNPISVSPAIIKKDDSVIIVFGTGGADWAANDSVYKVYAIDATTPNTNKSYNVGGGTDYWITTLPVGEKVWSSPTIFKNQIYLATASGSMESTDPSNDLAGAGKLRIFNLDDGSEPEDAQDIGKVRGSIYIDRDQVYMTTIDNQIIRIGDGTFSEDIKRAAIKAWHHVEE